MPRPSPLCAATVSGERYSAFHDACFDGRVTHLTTDKAGARLPPSLRQLFSFMWLFTLDLVPENSADSAFISEPLHFAITSHGFLYGPHLAVRTVISPALCPDPRDPGRLRCWTTAKRGESNRIFSQGSHLEKTAKNQLLKSRFGEPPWAQTPACRSGGFR